MKIYRLISKNKFPAFIMFITLFCLSLNACLYAEVNKVPIQYAFYNNKLIEMVRLPLLKIQNVIDNAINVHKNTLSENSVKVLENNKDFNWVFTTEGASIVAPTIDSEDGDIIALTTDIDVALDLKNQTIKIGELKSNVYALKPTFTVGGKRRFRGESNNNKKWEFNDVKGAAVFSAAILNDGVIIVEAIDATFDIENNILGNVTSRLYGLDGEGNNKWGDSLNFDNKIFVTPPFVGPNNTIFTTTLEINDFSNINVKDLKSLVSAVDPASGNVIWSFDPADFVKNDPVITIAPPAFGKSDETIFVTAVSPLTDEKIGEFIADTLKTSSSDVAKLVEDAINEILADIEKKSDFSSITSGFSDKAKSVLENMANKTIMEFLEMTTVFALDSKNGEVKWQSALSGLSISSPVVVNSNELNIGNINFVAETIMDVEVQEVTFDISDPNNTIEMEFKVEAAKTANMNVKQFGTLNSIKITDGELLWTKNIVEPILFKPITTINGDQTIVGGVNFSITKDENLGTTISDLSSKIYAVNVKDGDVAWESKLFEGSIGSSPIGFLNGAPILKGTDGSLFFAVFDFEVNKENEISKSTNVYALNLDGSTKWPNPFKLDVFLIANPAVSSETGSIFLSVNDTFEPTQSLEQKLTSKLISLNQKDGSILKTIEMDGLTVTSPVIDNGNDAVYASTSSYKIIKRSSSLDLFSLVHSVPLN